MDSKLLAEYFETGCFGEIALVYNAPRAATVRTTEESELYSLDVGSFRHVLREQAGAREFPATVQMSLIMNYKTCFKVNAPI